MLSATRSLFLPEVVPHASETVRICHMHHCIQAADSFKALSTADQEPRLGFRSRAYSVEEISAPLL